MSDKTEFFECHCSSLEHTIRFSLFDEDDEIPELYCSMLMCDRRNIFKRIWLAIKYVFGYKTRFDMVGEWLLNPDDSSRLKSLLKEYVEAHNRWVNKRIPNE